MPPRRHSPEPLGTSDGSGRGLAASRDRRGQTGSGRGHVPGTSSPLAVASEHVSGGAPPAKASERRGRARRGGWDRRRAQPRRAERRVLPALPRALPTPPRAPSRVRPHAARASPGGSGASSPERRRQGCWRRSPLFCSCFPRVGGRAGGRCRYSCREGLTTQSDPAGESDADPGTARGGCGAPRRAGTSSSRTRSRAAPGASCVTMDIPLLAAPSSRSERPPARPPAAEAAAWLLRRRPGDQLAAAAAAAAGERRSRKRGEGRSRSTPRPLGVSTQ